MGKWEMVRLGDVGTIITGSTPKTSDAQNYSANDLSFFKPGDIAENTISLLSSSQDFVSDYARPHCRVVPPNSILVTCIGIIGKIGITAHESTCNQQINAIIPNSKMCNPNYLACAISRAKREMNHIANAAVVPIINKSQFSNIQIPLPPLPIQQKIADVLDCASALIEKRKAQISKLDLLVKSRFVEMFGDPVRNEKGWEVKPLSKIIIHANNGMARRGNDENGSIVLRLIELQNGYIDYSKPNRISLDDAEKGRYLLKNGDFLFARVNGNPEYVGRCAVFKNICESVYHNDHIIRVRFDGEQLDGLFASELFNSSYGKSEMKDKIKTSAGQYTINQAGIGDIKLPLPPFSLQTNFADFVQQSDKSKLEMRRGLDKLELLYKALIQKCFEGVM